MNAEIEIAADSDVDVNIGEENPDIKPRQCSECEAVYLEES